MEQMGIMEGLKEGRISAYDEETGAEERRFALHVQVDRERDPKIW